MRAPYKHRRRIAAVTASAVGCTLLTGLLALGTSAPRQDGADLPATGTVRLTPVAFAEPSAQPGAGAGAGAAGDGARVFRVTLDDTPGAG